MTRELYTPKDKAEVRDFLLKEQNNKCALTGLPLDKSQAILEHAHDDEMFVRGVTSRAANSLLGVIENNFKRYCAWWFSGTISEFLRQCAQYLERPHDKRYRHDHWLKKCSILFNKLPEGAKKEVLHELGQTQGGNAAERKKLFRTALLSREYSYDEVRRLIDSKRKDT